MKNYVFILCMLIAQLGVSQLIVKPIIKSKNEIRARNAETKTVNPATLPFWDDFSMSSDSVDGIRIWGTDSTRQWNTDSSKNVYVNATLAINPPTYNVVTFDGLDENGGFHNDVYQWGDQLLSDTIDLQGKANVVLSFYWQAGGNVEIPEEGDSLRLQFYNPNAADKKWITEWLVDGADITNGEDTVFTQEAIEVPSEYLTQEFRFRFQSFGDKDGPFDAWHLDYIYMDENRGDDDFYYDDISLNSQPTTLLSPFHSIPVNQLIKNDFSGPVSITASALEKPDASNAGVPARYKIELRELISSTFIDSLDFGDQPTIPVNQDPFIISAPLSIETSGYDLSLLPSMDSMILESKIYIANNIDSLFANLNIDQFNDTIRTQYLLHNYYAYDDGTAEYAAGTNIDGGQVAIKFWLEQPDTLTHVDIHFPNIDPLSGGSPLELRIFKNLLDDPIRKQDILVENATALNQFTRYKLARPLILSDTFYLGYEQSKNEYIGVGFDRSNIAASPYIYENKTGQWEQNTRLSGALMIRPVFAKVDSLVLSTNLKEIPLKVYPNPTNGLMRIEGSYEAITLIDFSGRILANEASKSIHDFSSLKAGLYLLTIHRKEGDQTLKIIKK